MLSDSAGIDTHVGVGGAIRRPSRPKPRSPAA